MAVYAFILVGVLAKETQFTFSRPQPSERTRQRAVEAAVAPLVGDHREVVREEVDRRPPPEEHMVRVGGTARILLCEMGEWSLALIRSVERAPALARRHRANADRIVALRHARLHRLPRHHSTLIPQEPDPLPPRTP